MNNKLIVAALLALGGAVTAQAFASSGYGPAPRYDLIADASSVQHGPHMRALRVQPASADMNADMQAFGGMPDTASQSGPGPGPGTNHRAIFNEPRSLYARH